MKNKEKKYKPSAWLTGFLFISFLFILFIEVMIREVSFITSVLSVMALLIFVAMIDLLRSKVMVNNSQIEIVGLFKKEIISISDVEKSKIEDHEIWIILKDGSTKRMPSWFGGRRSLHKILNHKLKNR